jgi:hypothetical protein
MRRSAIIAGVSAGLLTITATAAMAATPDPWPANGFRPTCDKVNILLTSPFTFQYTDTTPPTITNLQATPKVVIGPGVSPKAKLTAQFTDRCSGVGQGVLLYSINGGPVSEADWSPTGTDGFRQSYEYDTAALPSNQAPFVLTYTVLMVWNRYSSFTLGLDDKLVASTPESVPSAPITVNTTVPKTYVVDASTLTATAPAKAKKGSALKVSGVLKNWNGTTWVAHSGVPVSLQRKVGNGKWVTVGTLNTSGSGAVSITTTAASTAKYQLIYKANLANGIDSATSKFLTVTVK